MSDQPSTPESVPTPPSQPESTTPSPDPAAPAPSAAVPPAPEAPTPAPAATPPALAAPTPPTAPAPVGETEAPLTAPAPARPVRRDDYLWGTGRRKSSVARVRIKPGEGKYLINKREPDHYFSEEKDRTLIVAPLKTTGVLGKIDVLVTVHGGGCTGQAGAIALGLGRALKLMDSTHESALRANGFLTRDPRMKERKKYGQRGARRRFQFSKR